MMLSTICSLAKAAISSPIVRTVGSAAISYAANKIFNDSSSYSSCDTSSSSQRNEHVTYNNTVHNHYYMSPNATTHNTCTKSTVPSNNDSGVKHQNVFLYEFNKWSGAGFTFMNTVRLSLKYTMQYYDDINNGRDYIEMKPLITMKNQ